MAKILVIEDERIIRENILELLETEDFEVFGAENGKVGIALAIENKPDLIVCDVMMPEIDGYGVLKALREQPSTATIPFIFLTALADKSDTRRGMELGADDYLTKPCTPNQLLAAISTRLEKQAVFQRQQAQKLNDLRSNIIQALPHELRTPLNGILGFADLLLQEYESLEPSEVREMLVEIRRSGKRLYRLVQNYLLYAELELIASDEKRIQALRNSQPTECQALISDTALKVAKEAERERDLHLDIAEAEVQIPPTRLQKIIEELVDNAFKFSKPSTAVTLTGTLQDNKYILVIADRGRGMNSAQISEIGAYMQFERKLYEQQGSGLGLVISKRLVELHNGELNIESIAGEQTTLSLILPGGCLVE
ncbi:response regulator [Ancylothrix sp. C2]|uniref:hybrid sensor histidine kinase/response regulator n=1 Tax=Ancylothrix sp. D3o TaxID=2953691 RepID=UPI0021BB50C9|nr:response regulator [Ancylothrix sp. D3o]MCT7949571.1 response regulator [Ancylothrix sp. D3o]